VKTNESAIPADALGPAGGDAFLPAAWRPVALVACHAIALAVLASWIWVPARAAWDALDAAFFHAVNGSLAGGGAWARAMALANMRLADAFVAVVMLAFLLREGWIFRRPRVRPALYAMLALLALLLAIREGVFAELVRAMHWQRESPSLTLQGAVRLGRMFPGLDHAVHIKDSSSRSFPGDHASVVFLWAAFLWRSASVGKRALVAGLAALFVLPRLVGGAHYLSDVLVGGVVLALLAYGWGLCTPYASRAAALLDRLARPAMRKLAKVPGLGRLSVMEGMDSA
jgi:membrane-associated phospholipid phosphatase